jgi:hypothetical protein
MEMIRNNRIALYLIWPKKGTSSRSTAEAVTHYIEYSLFEWTPSAYMYHVIAATTVPFLIGLSYYTVLCHAILIFNQIRNNKT